MNGDGHQAPLLRRGEPDGQHVYATSAKDPRRSLDRDRDRRPTPVKRRSGRVTSVVNTVALSPDGVNLYTTAYDGNAVDVFRLTVVPATTTSTSTSTSTSTTSTSTSTTRTSPSPTTTSTSSPASTSTSTTSASSSTTTTTLPGCGPAPQTGCKQPRASTLRLHTGAADAKNRLAWLWTRGAETTLANFGDPTTATDYRLCIYDHAATTPTLALDAAVPAGGACNGTPCWRHHRAGFRFRSTDCADGGISQIDLKPGRERKAAIAVKAHGASLLLPALPLTLPVRVELRASNGSCWEATAKVVGKGAAQ